MNNTYSIEVTCLFCEATLKAEEGKEYKSGDLIKCYECNEMNDYDALVDLAKEKGLKVVKADVENHIKSKFKNLFK